MDNRESVRPVSRVELEGEPISFMPDQRTALWHHLCARRAEVAGAASRLNRIDSGWGDRRLGEALRELDELIELVCPPSYNS